MSTAGIGPTVERQASGWRGDDLAVALVLPFRGPAGLYGPSCQVSAQLAIEELNAQRGIAGREIRPVEVDGGQHPEVVAAQIDRLATVGEIDAVVDFARCLDRVERSGADTVLMFLIGQDMVHFNRQFARRGLDSRMLRFSAMLDENALLGIGSRGTSRLYAAAGYFGSLSTAASLDFVGKIASRFGLYAPPVTNLGESCYEGMHLLGQRRRRDEPLLAVAERLRYHSPRGDVTLSSNHVDQLVYMAVADGLAFDVTAQL